MHHIACVIIFCVIWLALPHRAQSDTLHLYLDADFSHSADAARAIELGIETALSEVGFFAGGHRLELKSFDNRGNALRSRKTMEAFAADIHALAIFGGMHSPPYLTNRQYINKSRLLLLLPWSAAGPITRAAEDEPNRIFRLSVDDRKAGPVLVRRALSTPGCERTALLLLDSGWGRSNRESMKAAFKSSGQTPAFTVMFPNALTREDAASAAKDITETGAGCVILLATARQSGLLVDELYAQSRDLRIISHWGILLGDFAERVPHYMRRSMGIEVLQTCGLRSETENRPALASALASLASKHAGVEHLSDIEANAGFVHGYDLTRIFIQAVNQAGAGDFWHRAGIEKRRDLVVSALQNLRHPVDGILKTYEKPFSEYSVQQPDAHEALGSADLCFARFDENGTLRLSEIPDPAGPVE